MNKRWILKTDIKSGIVPWVLYIIYLVSTFFLSYPFIASVQWYNDKPPVISIYLYIILIGVAIFSVYAAGMVFGETYRPQVTSYIAAFRPSLWQVFYKRILFFYLAFALPFCAYLFFAFKKINIYHRIYNLSEQGYLASETFGYDIPEPSSVYMNVAVQMLIVLLAYILLAILIICIAKNVKIAIITFLTYGIAEYFGFSSFLGGYTLISFCKGDTAVPNVLFANYTNLHIGIIVFSLIFASFITYKKIRY